MIVNPEQLIDNIPGATQIASEGHSGAASSLNHTSSDNQSTSNSATGLVGTMPLTASDMESFQRFTSEMFDPSIFEGFYQSPVDGISFPNGLWEGFPSGH